jgi:hypothetical protein
MGLPVEPSLRKMRLFKVAFVGLLVAAAFFLRAKEDAPLGSTSNANGAARSENWPSLTNRLAKVRLTQRSSFPLITNVNCVVVSTADLDWLCIKWITETQQVQNILAFVNGQRNDWSQQLDAPSGSIGFELFNGDEWEGYFGIGENFFTASQGALGEGLCKDCTQDEKRQVMALIGTLPAKLKDVELPNIEDITRILIFARGDLSPVKTITNFEQIKQITGFINDERLGWDSLWSGAPPPIVLKLQTGNKVVKEFGVDEDCFETAEDRWDAAGRHKNASKWEVQQILKLIGQLDVPKFKLKEVVH